MTRCATSAFRCLVVACLFAISPLALAQSLTALDIKRLTLEQLMEIDVYSPSRRPEPVQSTASAVFVLTNDDIRRSRALTVPDALRLVPGVQVARVDASRYAVSIRGFNERITHNLQVMIDGRSIYDPLFGGVFWEAHALMLEDVERIEVIRGPGGTLWGPNAMNGVINIITKKAGDTQGGLLTIGTGTSERAFGSVRQGWSTGKGSHARVYAKGFDREPGHYSPAAPYPEDRAEMRRTGFRWDGKFGMRDDVTVSGDFYDGDSAQLLPPANAPDSQNIRVKGGNLLARWQHRYSSTNAARLQFTYDNSEHDAERVGLDQERDTYDLEWQHGFEPLDKHQVVWGVGHRRTRDELLTVPPGQVHPVRRRDVSTFLYAQDTVALGHQVQLTFGAKIENTDYSDIEWQPNVRLGWTPTASQAWWAAVSRAVRIPSRLERDLLGGTGFGDRFEPEELLAYEVGHRRLVTQDFWYDVALFYNVYEKLRNFEPAPAFPFVQLRNFMQGETYGGEIALRWQTTPELRMDAAYTYLQFDLELDPASAANDAQVNTIENASPAQQFVLRAAYELSRDWELDGTLRFVDELSAFNIRAYTELDLGISWHPRSDLELSLVGQSLLDRRHREQIFEGNNGLASEVERSVYGSVRWKF